MELTMDQKRQLFISRFIFTIFLLIALGSANCTAQKNTQAELIKNITGQVWIHSFEDDEIGIEAYRPKEYNFPPARGREGFEIKEDGSFLFYGIAPTDGTQVDKGYWELGDEGIEVILSGNIAVNEMFMFEVISLGDGILKIKKKRLE